VSGIAVVLLVLYAIAAVLYVPALVDSDLTSTLNNAVSLRCTVQGYSHCDIPDGVHWTIDDPAILELFCDEFVNRENADVAWPSTVSSGQIVTVVIICNDESEMMVRFDGECAYISRMGWTYSVWDADGGPRTTVLEDFIARRAKMDGKEGGNGDSEKGVRKEKVSADQAGGGKGDKDKSN